MGMCRRTRKQGPPHLWGGVRRSRTEGPEQLTSSPSMGRCRAKRDGGARAGHLLPIYGEVSAFLWSSPFMGRCPAKPDGGARAARLLPIYGEVSGEAGRRGQSEP